MQGVNDVPVFSSIEEIKEYIISHSRPAVEAATNKVYTALRQFLDLYYAEYSPVVYERTYQMLASLVKTDVKSTGNGWYAEVYFDAGALDYSYKIMTKRVVDGGYMNPYNGAISSSGVFNNPYGSGEESLNSAMHGSHGGAASGTAIWDEAMTIFNGELINLLKQYLRQNGIPVM